jgi:sugar phosphate isomerase/epimerase
VIDLGRLSLNQATVQNLSALDAIELCARHDVAAIGLWRDKVARSGLAVTAATARAAGVQVSSLCRGGFFTHADAGRRQAAAADNRAAVLEAAALGADALILVAGGLVPGSKDLPVARQMISDAVAELVPFAQQAGVRLGIEALHPMFCADRSAISRLGEAVDLAVQFPADAVGVVVDTYHVWWDAQLAADIGRAAGRIVSYQLCDWVLPLPQDVLLGRGHLGDGYIDLRAITEMVLATGYAGFAEVEIFNQVIWDTPADDTVTTVKSRFADLAGAVATAERGRRVDGGRGGRDGV